MQYTLSALSRAPGPLFQDSSHTQAEEYFGTWAVGKWRSDASHEKEVWRMISAWITLLFLRCEYKGNHPVGVPEFCTTLEPVGTSSKVVYKLEPEAQRDPHKIPHGNWKYLDEKMPQNQIQRSNLQKMLALTAFQGCRIFSNFLTSDSRPLDSQGNDFFYAEKLAAGTSFCTDSQSQLWDRRRCRWDVSAFSDSYARFARDSIL